MTQLVFFCITNTKQKAHVWGDCAEEDLRYLVSGIRNDVDIGTGDRWRTAVHCSLESTA